jgi:hypothetical protein
MLNILKTIAHFFTAFLLFSCSNKQPQDLNLINILNEGLTKSNQTIQQQNKIIYTAIEQKSLERRSSNTAKIWLSKAQSIKEISRNLDLYIQNLKDILIKEANIDFSPKKVTDKLDDTKSVQNIFGSGSKQNELFQYLEKFKDSLLIIDSSINMTFRNTIALSDNVVIALSVTNFSNKTIIEVLAMLTELQAKIKVNENQMLSYCLQHSTPYIGCGYSRGPKLLITQSSSYVKAGEIISVNVGIGTFFAETDPVIFINNKSTNIGIDGSANTSIKASTKPGIHTIPIKATYYKPDGTEETRETEIKYEVADNS